MALTIANYGTPGSTITEGTLLGFKARMVKITFDSVYPDEGETVNASDLGWDVVVGFIPMGQGMVADNTTGFAPHVEVAAAQTSLNIIAVVGGGDGAPLEEEAASTDLSSHILYGIVLGY